MLNTRTIAFGLALSAALAAIALSGLAEAEPASANAAVSGEFELLDQTGNTVTAHSFDGKLRLVFFGFTQCPDICPTTMLEIREALRILGDDASGVQPIFISIDRDNDTPEVLANYVAAFHPSFVGLTGSAQQIASAATAFNVTYGVQQGGVYHSSYLFLMDREGRFLDILGYGSKAKVIADRLREYL